MLLELLPEVCQGISYYIQYQQMFAITKITPSQSKQFSLQLNFPHVFIRSVTFNKISARNFNISSYYKRAKMEEMNYRWEIVDLQCIYIYICIYILCIHVCICVYLYICVYMYISVYIYGYMYMYIHAYIYM